MAKNSRKNRRRRPKSATNNQSKLHVHSNFVSEAGIGCYIAQRGNTAKSNDWGMLEWEDDIDPDDFGGQEVPDVALDPHDKTLTLCNITGNTRVAYITVYDDTPLRNKNGQRLIAASTTDNSGRTRRCVTFIVLCPPRTFAHLCTIDILDHQSMMDVDIDSDVQDWTAHPNLEDTHPVLLGFPLACSNQNRQEAGGVQGEKITNDEDRRDESLVEQAYLCTQGEGGRLTHFFAGNLHAIDFRCSVGTPLLAVGDGVVTHVQDRNTLSGVAVSNLFEWNSILVEMDSCKGVDQSAVGGPLFVEYVHVQTRSALVRPGDRVKKGQPIGSSGSVGFSPEPHLHFCAYRSQEPTAPTVRVYFESRGISSPKFLPLAGKWYNANGEVVR